MPACIPPGICALDDRDLRADASNDVERVRSGQDPDAHEHGGLTVEANVLLVVLRAEHHVGDVADSDDDAVRFLDDELAELLRRAQVGIGDQVHRYHRPFRAPERGEVVVARQGLAQHGRGDAVRRHPVRLEPDAHGERAIAQDVCALDAADGAQPRLDHANEIVRNLVLIEVGRGEAEVERSELRIGVLHLDDRRLRLWRQVVANLGHLRLDLREGIVGVVVEPQVHGNRAETLRARRLHVVDTVRAGDDALERRRNEPAHEIGVGADVSRRDADDRDVAARVLPHAQRADRLQARRSE